MNYKAIKESAHRLEGISFIMRLAAGGAENGVLLECKKSLMEIAKVVSDQISDDSEAEQALSSRCIDNIL